MKKTPNKKLRLELRKETVAMLGDTQLRDIAAGNEPTMSARMPCSNVATCFTMKIDQDA